MLKIIIVGNNELASSLLLGALESGHQMVGVLRWEKAKTHPIKCFFKDVFRLDPFYSLIKSYKIPEIKAKGVNTEQFKKQALKMNPDIILVGSWGEILKKDAILLPKIACINCHPSLLPKHRGSNPYFSTINKGEKKTGITFHLVNEEIDAGSVLLQKQVNISDNDTGGSLRTKCAFKAREALPELLNGLEDGLLIPVEQNSKNSTYYPAINQDDLMINWKNNANDIYNRIRALNPWACCYTLHNDQFLKFNSSKIIDIEEHDYLEGTILKTIKNDMLISTIDKNRAILLKNVTVYGLASRLWSWFYLKYFIKKGDLLENN